MSTSNILGGQPVPEQPEGTDTDALGPSDSSDSGSDVRNARPMPTRPEDPDELGAVPPDVDDDSDAAGTGDRPSAVSEEADDGADIAPDRIVSTQDDPDSIGPRGPDAGTRVADLADDNADEDEGEGEGDEDREGRAG